MILYIDTPKTGIRVKNEGFFIENDEAQQLIMPNKVSQVILGNGVSLLTDVLILAERHGIPVYIEDSFGNIKLQCRSIEYSLSADIRRDQLLFVLNTEARVRWSKWLFKTKMANQLKVISFVADRKNRLFDAKNEFVEAVNEVRMKIDSIQNRDFDVFRESVLGYEGSIARKYWGLIAEAVGDEWAFGGRNRQPARDAFNASLNYLYGILYTEVENQLYLAGLDAHQGIFHGEQYQKPVLSFDFIELFRAWVDKLLIKLIWADNLNKDDFTLTDEGCTINKEAKAVLIPAFKRMMNGRKMFNGRNATAREHIRISIESLKTQFKDVIPDKL